MKLTVMKTGLWLGATIAAAAIALGAGQEAPDNAKSERLLNSACTACHDLRKIQTQALDADAWTKIVDSMIEKGAKVDKADIPMLVSYLEDNFGPLPEGAGKEIVLNKCTVCHDLKRVRQHFATPEDWADTLNAMQNEGLMISDDDLITVLKYLARNFREQ
jgi:cytochrome c5